MLGAPRWVVKLSLWLAGLAIVGSFAWWFGPQTAWALVLMFATWAGATATASIAAYGIGTRREALRLKAEHENALKEKETHYAGLLTQGTTERDKASGEHTESIAKLTDAHNTELAKLRSEHDKALAEANKAHDEERQKTQKANESTLTEERERLRAEHDKAISKALAEGHRTAQASIEKETLNTPLNRFLHAEIYIAQGHGLILRRGGHSTDWLADIRLGVRITNLSPHQVTVCKIAITRLLVDGIGLPVPKDPHIVTVGRVDAWRHGSIIDDIGLLNIQAKFLPPLSDKETTKVYVECMLTVAGEWGPEPKAHPFFDSVHLTPTIDYTPEMRMAVDTLAQELNEHRLTLIDANLRYGSDRWGWDVEVAPRVRVTVDVPDHTPEEARRKSVLRDVAKRAAESVRAAFGGTAGDVGEHRG